MSVCACVCLALSTNSTVHWIKLVLLLLLLAICLWPQMGGGLPLSSRGQFFQCSSVHRGFTPPLHARLPMPIRHFDRGPVVGSGVWCYWVSSSRRPPYIYAILTVHAKPIDCRYNQAKQNSVAVCGNASAVMLVHCWWTIAYQPDHHTTCSWLASLVDWDLLWQR